MSDQVSHPYKPAGKITVLLLNPVVEISCSDAAQYKWLSLHYRLYSCLWRSPHLLCPQVSEDCLAYCTVSNVMSSSLLCDIYCDTVEQLAISHMQNRYFSWSINLPKPTGHVMHQQFNIQQLYPLPHTVFMCFVFIWEQTATCATYSINWLVFIIQMKSVYSAVRPGSLNKAVCGSSLNG